MAQKQTGRPNVVVFLTDQQRWDTAGVHGNPLDLTPAFDRMASRGTHLYNAFTPQPVCGPARSCLQTGLYATQTGCYRNAIPLPQNAKTLAHYFGEAGYDTAYIGKWHLASQNPVPEAERGGYKYWLGANAIELVSYPYTTVVWDNDNQHVMLPGYRVDAITDAAIRYLKQPRDEPFFLFVSHLEPHQQNNLDQCVAPDGYRERYADAWTPPDLKLPGSSAPKQLAGYYGCVKRLDEAFDRMLGALRSLDLLDDTIVLFTSDHGCHFHTRPGGYKRSCHDSSMRVPMAIQGPGFDGGGEIRQLVSLLDVPPTLLDAAGLPVPEHMQGRSFLPLVRGDAAGWPREVFAQISESQVARAVRTHRWKYNVVAEDANGWRTPSSDCYTEDSLYDLENDPYELENLVGRESHQEVAATMRGRLIRRMVEAGEEAPDIILKESRRAGPYRVMPFEAKQ